jgi:glucose uptake protein GlcU
MTLIALGGLVYVWASIDGSATLFAVAVGLVGCGLLVHLSDPVVRSERVTAASLLVAAVAAFVDAALTAGHDTGPGSAIALIVLVGGVLVASWSRKSRP